MIKEYDKVRLKTGELARILEILNSDIFLAEVVNQNGDIDTVEIERKNIAVKIIEVEQVI